MAGANDGQLHAFLTGNLAEAWSFIPPNLLDRLKDIAHRNHPAGLTHQFYVDGPITVADVWAGAGDGKVKSPGDWRTMLVVGLGRGGTRNLWSSSSSCDSGFSNVYRAGGDYPHYCGYHALDITDTLNPSYRWTIKPTAAQAPFLGDPWSRMAIRRVRLGTDEKWVGLLGGGHNASPCAGAADCAARGSGFFVVDLATGNVLWSFNRNSSGGGAMKYALPSMAAVVDADQDGFADRAYIGDLGGNIWRFTFCRLSDGDGCSTADWKGSLLYQGAGLSGPVYYAPSVAKDVAGNYWLYWGTGDRLEPAAVQGYKDRFYGMRDLGKPTARTKDDLQDISAASKTFTQLDTKDGWYIELGGTGEKVLETATVFNGIVSFTTYTPASASPDPCDVAGDARLYSVAYIDGAGSLTGGTRSAWLGKGIASGVAVSAGTLAGHGGAFVNVSGGSKDSGRPLSAPVPIRWPDNMTHMLHWRDARFR